VSALWLAGVALVAAEGLGGPPVLSAEVRTLLHTWEHGGPRGPEQDLLLQGDRLRVLVRFDAAPTPQGLARLSGRHWDFATLDGEPVHTALTYAASVPFEALQDLAASPDVVRIELGRSLGLTPPVDLSATWIGVDEVRGRAADRGAPALGHRVLVVDFDTGIDLSQPLLNHLDGGLYDWVDSDGDGVLTVGTDEVEVDGAFGVLEVLQGAVWDAWGTDDSSAHGYGRDFEPDLDLLFVDLNGDGVRDQADREDTPGLGEPTFVAEDLDLDGVVSSGEWLVRLGTPKTAASWTAGGGLLERGVDLLQTPRDPHGHGTSVTSILGAGHPGLSAYASMAPGADLAAFSYYADWELFDWVTAIETARTLGPDVLLYEVGDFTGEFQDGSSLFEQAVTDAAEDAVNVCPAGNVGENGKHGLREVGPEGGHAGLYALGPDQGYDITYAYITVTWQGGADVALTWQDGSGGQQIDVRTDGEWSNDNKNNWFKATADTSTRGTKMLLVEWSRWDGANYDTIEGYGYLGIDPTQTAEGHVWTSDNASSWSGGLVNWLPSWGWGEEWSWADATSSATSPSTSDACIALTSFQTRTSVYGGDESAHPTAPLSGFSGRGPRIDGEDLVDLAAPGHYDIRTLDSTVNTPQNTWTFFGGTSAAGPHVASAAALLRGVHPGATHAEVEAALQEGAARDSETGSTSYDHDWGYGRLRADAGLVALDRSPPSFEVLAIESPFAPVRRLWVVPGEELVDGPTCTAGGVAVDLVDADGGVWFGTAPIDGELSCEGTDLAGNSGGSVTVVAE